MVEQALAESGESGVITLYFTYGRWLTIDQVELEEQGVCGRALWERVSTANSYHTHEYRGYMPRRCRYYIGIASVRSGHDTGLWGAIRNAW